MHALAHQVLVYLQKLGLPASVLRAYPKEGIPYFLTDAFALTATDVEGRPVLLAIDQEVGRSPTDVERLMSQLIKEAAGVWPIYATAALNPYARKRLIERQIPFVVPHRQFYAPRLGLDLREHFPWSDESPKADGLSPATQAMFIHSLMREQWQPDWMPADTCAALGYSAMTASRATRELVNAGLAAAEMVPRNKAKIVFEFGPRELWERALPLLRSPTQRTCFVRSTKLTLEDTIFREAGLLALCRLTMLAEPRWKMYAMDRAAWRTWRHNVETLPSYEPGAVQMQVWTYSPRLVPNDHMVDPFSLYLSLREAKDERVQSALDELTERLRKGLFRTHSAAHTKQVDI